MLPGVRRLGIGERLVRELGKNLEVRAAVSDIALNPESSEAGSSYCINLDMLLIFKSEQW